MAKSFPPWQHTTLTILKTMYEENGGIFPNNRDVMTRLKEVDQVKKYMKKLMPFVQYVKVRACIDCLIWSISKMELLKVALLLFLVR